MRNRIVPIAWLLTLLCLPAISLVLGVRQPLMDNRPKAKWPSIHATDLLEAKTYKKLDAAWLERIPTRKQSVQAHSQISVGVFGESPDPDIAVGRHGWLYYTWALRTCRDRKPTVDPADAAEITALTIIASGRRALIVEPADKMLIHPSKAPRFPRRITQCVAALQRRVADRLATTPGGVDIDARLRRLEATGRSTFLPHDSHWNYRGRLAYARLVLDFIAPGLSRATGLHVGRWYDRHSDLYRQLGLPATDRDRAVLLRRASPQPARSGRTLILGDSQTIETFLEPPAPGIRPIAEQLPQGTVVCPIEEEFYVGTCDQAVDQASAIAIESVGRNVLKFEATCSQLVAWITQTMLGVEGQYALADGAAGQIGDRIVFGQNGKMVVRVVPARGDVRSEARLLRIPVETLPPGEDIKMVQQPVVGARTPCSTPAVGTAGVALALPLPAHRRASDIVVRLEAPPGTTLGPPQEVPLTGSDTTGTQVP
jgi:SGNH hydrolase-like domain, acetyltransferase AlgX